MINLIKTSPLAHDILNYLTDLQFQYWGILAIVSSFIIVFSALPKHRSSFRSARLIVALVISFLFLSLSHYTNKASDRAEFEACKLGDETNNFETRSFDECREKLTFFVNRVDYREEKRLLLTFAIVGFLEILWLFVYEKKIKNLEQDYKRSFIETFLIIMFFIYVTYPYLLLLFLLVIKYFVPTPNLPLSLY
jgi:hypothetical protein